MAPIELKRILRLAGITALAALLMSGASWAQDISDDATAPDDGATDPDVTAIYVVDDGFVQNYHDLNPGCDPCDVVTPSGDEEEVKVITDPVEGDDPQAVELDDPAVDDGSGDDGSGDPAVDDGSGDWVKGGDDGVVYDTLDPDSCINCYVMMNMGEVERTATLPQVAVGQGQSLSHESSGRSTEPCGSGAIAWLCEWKTGKSN